MDSPGGMHLRRWLRTSWESSPGGPKPSAPPPLCAPSGAANLSTRVRRVEGAAQVRCSRSRTREAEASQSVLA